MSETLQLDLDVVLPHAHGAEDRCVAELIASVQRLDRVESAHVTVVGTDRSDGSATLCMHLAPGAVSIRRLNDRVRASGATIDGRYGHVVARVDGVGNSSRAHAFTQQLRSTHGVVDAAVTIDGVVRVEYEKSAADENAISDALEQLGLRRRAHSGHHDHDAEAEHGQGSSDGHGHDHGHGASPLELGAAIVSTLVYLVARSLDWFSDLDGPVTTLYVIAAFVTGVFVARDAWLSVRAKVFDIDQLMLVAAVGAAFIGHWSDSALLLVLFSLGHALEGYAMNRARNAIEALGELAPAVARRRDAPDVDVPVAQLAVGDVVVVRPNERIPADGAIVAGETAIDESAVTGESVPVDKTAMVDSAEAVVADAVAAEHRTFAGTLNGPGAIEGAAGGCGLHPRPGRTAGRRGRDPDLADAAADQAYCPSLRPLGVGSRRRAVGRAPTGRRAVRRLPEGVVVVHRASVVVDCGGSGSGGDHVAATTSAFARTVSGYRRSTTPSGPTARSETSRTELRPIQNTAASMAPHPITASAKAQPRPQPNNSASATAAISNHMCRKPVSFLIR